MLGADPAHGDEAWRARIGVVLQSWRDHGKWRVRELLSHLGAYYAPYGSERIRRPWDTDDLIAAVGLTEQAGAKIMSLSGGQRRRLDVAIGIVGRPELLFLDEPTAGFDPQARREFHDLVHRLADDQQTTILLTTHDLDEAEKLADRILILAGGRIIADGSAAFGIGQLLSMEREDGTLLRAKATPNGMVGYLVGKVVTVSGWVLVPFVIVLIPGLFLVGGTELNTVGAWLSLIGIVLLGMLATLPIGACIGSLFVSPRGVGFASMPIMGLVAVSGIFYPITSMPGWVQGLAQCFPVYWLGLGMRAAMLPDEAASVELGGSWRHLETVAVLGIWAAAGFLVAPILLRRMARRESGSSVAARREKAMQRAY